MAFKAILLDLFEIPPGTVMMLRLAEGTPKIGDRIETRIGTGQIIGLQDGGPQTRNGLSGTPAEPQIGILTDLPFPTQTDAEIYKSPVNSIDSGGARA